MRRLALQGNAVTPGKKILHCALLLSIWFFGVRCNTDKEPEQNSVPDYRDVFTGQYLCHQTGNYHCGDSTLTFDTILLVTVRKSGDSMIHMLDATLKLNTNGTFGGGLYPDSAYHGFGGRFAADSLFFDTYQGGLGCFTSLNYTGKKQ